MARPAVVVIVIACLLTFNAAESSNEPSAVIELDDSNFEHLTQATTGATTGDWFVAFVAPWCGHCKRLHPTWEELAKELKGMINVARLDATANEYTASRFNIRGFPTIKFLRQGKMYDYNGARTVEALKEFALDQSKRGEGKPIPPPITFLQMLRLEVETLAQDVKMLVMRKTDATVLIFCLGFIAGVFFASLFYFCCERRSANQQVAAAVAATASTNSAATTKKQQ